MTFLLPVGRCVGPPSVPVRPSRVVAGWFLGVAFEVSPNLTKHREKSSGYWGREADSCQSDGRAIAVSTSVDTGTHERVANWSPDVGGTVDPCDPGTDPRNGPFAGISHGVVFFSLSCTVKCPRPWWYAATSSTCWNIATVVAKRFRCAEVLIMTQIDCGF